MDLGLAGRVAVVTGASQGIGKACALALAAEGASIVAVSRDPARNATAVAAIAAASAAATRPGRIVAAPADLNDAMATQAVFARALEEFGHLDILVNCAATIGRGDLFSLDEAALARVFDDKFNGSARCIRLAASPMRAQRWGRIINVLGGAGRQPQPAAVAVGLNNAAMLNLIKAVAGDLARDNVLINAVIPSAIRTERLDAAIRAEAARSGKAESALWSDRASRVPLGRMGEGGEVGAVVAFLASERASFVTGCAWPVDGGAAAVI
jgi:NAD(P)-dependent dehydrogenase (short-subunit alcohol dehydrogenase family)